MRNGEERLLCSLDDENSILSYHDDSDILWLDEFMDAYGVADLDSDVDFNMRTINNTVVSTLQSEQNSIAELTPIGKESNNEVLTDVSS